MIERGIIEWLVEYLQGTESHNSYGLEYSTALLMNLCLHKSGKEKIVPIAKSVLDILTRLLTFNVRQVGKENGTHGRKEIRVVNYFADIPIREWCPLQSPR